MDEGRDHILQLRAWLACRPAPPGGPCSELAIDNVPERKQALGLSLQLGSKGMNFSGKMVHTAIFVFCMSWRTLRPGPRGLEPPRPRALGNLLTAAVVGAAPQTAPLNGVIHLAMMGGPPADGGAFAPGICFVGVLRAERRRQGRDSPQVWALGREVGGPGEDRHETPFPATAAEEGGVLQ